MFSSHVAVHSHFGYYGTYLFTPEDFMLRQILLQILQHNQTCMIFVLPFPPDYESTADTAPRTEMIFTGPTTPKFRTTASRSVVPS